MKKKNASAWLLTGLDLAVIAAAYLLSMLLRYERELFEVFLTVPLSFAGAVGFTWIVFEVCLYLTGAWHVLWGYAGYRDIACVGISALFAGMATLIVMRFCHAFLHLGSMSWSVFLLASILTAGGCGLVRIGARYLARRRQDHAKEQNGEAGVGRIMLIGGGEMGYQLLHELAESRQFRGSKVVCVIDDDPHKKGRTVYGTLVVGGRECILPSVEKYRIDTILFAIANCTKQQQSSILELCSRTGCEIRILPSTQAVLEGKIDTKQIRRVEIEDLLGRDQIVINNEELSTFLGGKVVMVTGAGGSIGSELCRQIAKRTPSTLVMLDIYENSLYDIQLELKKQYPDLNTVVLIGSIRDRKRLRGIFEQYQPSIVFHAAAHKHVPLMEDSPHEALKNNVLGTYNLASEADRAGVACFVQISTDKAVNPTNVMGASKRMCEMIVQMFGRRSKTRFVAVRFGNVLGSNGSVIPIFRRQIAAGGPVEVTHPEITRFFMTIPEAVSLVLEAGSRAKGGEIFILDMGKPMKILELAEKMITLSGYRPYTEIPIVFTGLRPGEKLYEELLMNEEGIQKTDHSLIFVGKPILFDDTVFERELQSLAVTLEDETVDVRPIIKHFVPTYVMPEEREAEKP